MPTYEYRCPKGHSFDVFQRMSDEPGAECPTCGKAAERQISAGGGLLFKGSGFYITDSRSPEYAKKATAEKNHGKEGASKVEGTSGEGSKGQGSKGDEKSDSGAKGGVGKESGTKTTTSGTAKGGSGSSSSSGGD